MPTVSCVLMLVAAVTLGSEGQTFQVPFSGSGNFATTVTLPKYNNPSPLANALIEILSVMTSGTATITNNGSIPQTYTTQIDSEISLNGPGVSGLTLDALSPPRTDTVPGNNGSLTYSFAASGGPESTLITNPAQLTQFVGSGSLTYSVNGTGNIILLNGPTPAQFTLTSDASGIIEVVYTAVPEPSVLSLSAVGFVSLLGFIGISRRWARYSNGSRYR